MKNNFYSYGSLACKDLEYCEPQQETKKINKRKSNYKSKIVLMFCLFLFIVFINSLVILTTISIKISKANQIINLNQKLNNIKSENIILEEMFSKKFDLSHVKKIAEEKLNMHAPYPYQIVYINIKTKQ